MCFAGKFPYKSRRYVSIACCPKKRLPLDNLRTIKDLDGNYHFWCVDRETGEIIDNTPQSAPPDERRIKEDPLFIPWCEEWQTEQREYCENNLYTTSTGGFGGCLLSKEEVDDWLIEIVEYEEYRERKCFTNSYALWKSNPKRYRLVCGSLGWLLEDKPNHQIIGLDYGY